MDGKLIDLPEIAIIGREGFCTAGRNIAGDLWDQAASHFDEVARLGMKEKDGSYVGFWGAMSDETMSFLPWTEEFSTGFYLAGIEVYADAQPPEGWTKWILPARGYLVTPVQPEEYMEKFSRVLRHTIPENGLRLTGAVCDFVEPATGAKKLFFPVAEI